MTRRPAMATWLVASMFGVWASSAAAARSEAPGLASALARPAGGEGSAGAWVPDAPPSVGAWNDIPRWAVDGPTVGASDPDRSLLARREQTGGAPAADRSHAVETLTAERARTLLRSITVPGWGQAALGHRTAATVFGVAELGVWTTYTAFRIQERMRRDAYQRTAHILAGIDLHGRDEEFRRIVGSYISSDEYNQLVVYRDAANIYYDEHGVLRDPAGYQEYITKHSLGGDDAWSWPSDEDLLRYRGQRKDAQRAALRANAALALAVVDRLLSALHAARLGPGAAAHSWKLDTLPDPTDPTALRVGVRTSF